ncbi:MAG: PTS IIA-like nitrogen-regulatory protein PtsN [Gemmatimonadota bacterium]|nr:MAG: PTS IIA-like nitrogen-regulatory protein PtsN [Gemmatimonadota bacterium]
MIALADYLVPERVRLDVDVSRRREALAVLAELLGGQDKAAREQVLDDLIRREQMGSTGVGNGIAFPHARVDALPNLRLAFVRTEEPLEFAALDGREVDLFFALAGPTQSRREYLSALGSLSYLFRNDGSRRPFREATDVAGVVDLFRQLLEKTPRPDA